nr:hypothetical protein [Tanacetum cinerariifolium]
MESLSPQVVSAAKLPILNPNEFDLWKMRIEQVIEGVVRPLAPTTDKQRLARKNELKAREWRTHTLIWRNKADLEDQSLDDLFNSLKIYEAEVKSSSSAIPTTQKITFVSSQNTDNTNESVSVVASVSAASKKEEEPTNYALMAFTSLSSSCSDNEAEEEPTNYALMAFTSLSSSCSDNEAEEEPTNYALMAFTSSSSSSFDKVVASCSKACTKAYVTLQSYYDKLTNDLRKSQFDVLFYKIGLEFVEARLLVYQQNETVFEEDIKLTKLDVEVRDNALVALRQKFKKVEQERDELKLKLEKFQTSSKNLSQLLASQTNDKIKLGYDNQVFTSFMFDCDAMFSSDSDVSMHASPVYDRYHSGEGYHVVPPHYTRIFVPPKPDLVFHDAPNVNETVHIALNVELSPTKPDEDLSPQPLSLRIGPSVKPAEHPILANNLRKNSPKSRGHINSRNTKACFLNHAPRGNHQHFARMTHPNLQRHVVPTVVLTRSMLVPLTTARPVTTVFPHNNVTRPRLAKTVVTKPYSPPGRTINRSSSPKPSNFPPKVTTVKASKVNAVKGVQGNWGNPHHALKDKGVIDSGCSRHMTWNMSYLSDFEAINRVYVAFGGNPKGGKITGKDTECIILSPNFKLPDENHATLDESNLWLKSLGHIDFKTMNKLVKGNLVRGLPSKVFENNHACVACKKGKQHRASCKTKPVSSISQLLQRSPSLKLRSLSLKVHVSPSRSAKTKKHDDKTKREAKGKSPLWKTLLARNKMLKGIPTTSYDDLTASALCHLTITLQAKVADLSLGNNKWYQSLLRSFDQKKNNTQVQQSLLSWPSQAQVQKMRGLSQVEARLVEFKEYKVKFCERIRGLERDVEIRDNKIEYLKNELEHVKKEKESLDNKLTGLPEFVDDTVTDYSRPTPSIDASKCNKSELQSSKFYVSEHGESSGSIMSKPMIKFVKESDYPRVIKTNKTENARKSLVKYAEIYRNISK